MKVLLLADHCNPTFSSTPYFGYQIVRAIARKIQDATLVTQVRNRAALTKEALGVSELTFVDSEYIARPIWRLASWLQGDPNKAMTVNVALNYPSALAFEWEVWKRYGARLKNGEFDIVHRVTPLSPTVPSLLAKWSPVPVVIGPVNGGLRWPKNFGAELAREREWLTYLRGLHKWLPYYNSTYQKAAAILAGFQHTMQDLPRTVLSRTFDCSDVGYDDNTGDVNFERPSNSTMTALFVGRLVPYKCADVLVRAFAASELLRRHRLVIIGDGPDRPLIEELISKNSLEGCVELTGWLPHDEVMRRMRQADVFAFPSIRELGAGVVAEAMGMGLACITADYGAPGAYTRDGRGVAIPLTNKQELVHGYANALEELASNPEKRLRTSIAGQRYAKVNLTWTAKAKAILEVYEWVLGRRDKKPTFYRPDEGLIVA
jgi:glycosyltransferase involved in cell wall biosynthesis